ncbi:Gamma-glutamyltransferase [Beutenbergia cavernae DSM 12333]|uniref:Gamma-glutamyltransferase n=1 Tax=Beutenbergia cavernae (strain ATCC BAA-8 / DSM 12333 / CCUG 43141 / JCM 11478 / NBRC 16432 / NCIMB 13614 / HKI 0122) TaxID=471853 RepID=C5BX52_BEUC1|nr:gamma-glutamyltransferase [Beutenbergia cavernae]ACQ78727.1 Gamma-glutamyltransferase [Beutenbergia cavernae DSM 12333]
MAGVAPAPTFTTRPELLGTTGMVASTHWLASASGMAVLERGGNAFDAAVAAGLVLHVVEPHLNGVGGDMPLIAHDASASRTFVLCGQGSAPAGATIEAYRDLGLDLVPGTSHLAAVVPGAFGAWMHLLGRYGTLPLREVAQYAIGYARDGFPLVPQAATTIEAVADVFAEHWTASAEIYLGRGPGRRGAPAPRSRFANPLLAETLERLVAEGEAAGAGAAAQAEGARRAFYSGFVAEAVDAFVRTPAWDGVGGEDARHAGFLTADDLDAWRPSEEEPVTTAFGGLEIAKPGMWSQGPVLLAQLAMLERAGVADLAPGSPELVHLAVEVAKLAFADREAFYGDSLDADAPDAVVSAPALLDPAYLAERVALLGETAADGLRPGSPGGRTPRLAEHVVRAMADGGAWPDGLTTPRVGEGEPTVARGDTCHLDVVDRWGNVVSATPSGGWLQSSPAVPGLGFALPTRAQMFWLEPGLPASLRPGRRPRTTLSPGMALRDGRPAFAFGTPGGDQQDQWPVPFLVQHLLHGANLQAAIDAPSWHSTHVPSSFAPREAEPMGVRAEPRLGAAVLDDLRGRGHVVTEAGPWALGRISAAGMREDGMLVAAANPRGMQGYAVGR